MIGFGIKEIGDRQAGESLALEEGWRKIVSINELLDFISDNRLKLPEGFDVASITPSEKTTVAVQIPFKTERGIPGTVFLFTDLGADHKVSGYSFKIKLDK